MRPLDNYLTLGNNALPGVCSINMLGHCLKVCAFHVLCASLATMGTIEKGLLANASLHVLRLGGTAPYSTNRALASWRPQALHGVKKRSASGPFHDASNSN
jgi:hypothetical protein